MTQRELFFRLRAYDQICPLILGDVDILGATMRFDTHGALEMDFPQELHAAEVSFNRYVLSYARGEGELVGIPAFILRGYRHRNFFVRKDSKLTDLAGLRGKRVATNSWGDTGTLWARAAMRDAGVNMSDVQWVIGQFDAHTPNRPMTPKDLVPPADAEHLQPGDTLIAALLDGRVDAITTAFAPIDIFRNDGRVRRLVENYVEVEREYHRRTGIYPNFHIMAFRRKTAEAHPEVVVELYTALKRSWDIWWLKARRFAEATPWAMADLEAMAKEFAGDTPPFGLSRPSHQKMLAAICEEQHAQRLVDKPAAPAELFAGFLDVLRTLGLEEETLLPDTDLASARPLA